MNTQSDDSAGAQGPVFPRSISELTDVHLCPFCFAPLVTRSRCARCDFPLEAPEAEEIFDLSNRAAQLLRERGTVLDAVHRRDLEATRAQRAAATAEPAPHVAAAAPDIAAFPLAHDARVPDTTRTVGVVETPGPPFVQPPAAVPVRTTDPLNGPPPGPGWTGPAGGVFPPAQPPAAYAHVPVEQTSPPVAPAPEPKRVNVQLVLLSTGIALLGVAAIVFLTIAWVAFGLLPRAIVTMVVTAGTIVGASWLARLRLRATAEGVAALGALLVLLNAWAVRALDVGGLGSSGETLYWGTALLVLTLVFEVWHRLSGLRTPGIAASLSVLPGIGLLLASLASPLDAGDRLAVGLTGAAAGALLQILVRTTRIDAPVDGDEPSHGRGVPGAPTPPPVAPRRARSWASVLTSTAGAARPFEFHALTIVGIVAIAATFLTGLPALVIGRAVDVGPFIAPAVWVCTAIAGLQTVLLLRRSSPPSARPLAVVTACLAVVGFPLGGALLPGLGVPTSIAAGIAVAAAFVGPALVDIVRARIASDFHQALTIARGVALGTTALAYLHVLVTSPISFGNASSAGADVGDRDPLGPLRPSFDAFEPAAFWPWLGAALGLGVAIAALAIARRLAVHAGWVAAAASAVLVLAPFRAGQWLAATILFAVVVVAHLVVLLVADRRRATPVRSAIVRVAWWGLGVACVSALLLGDVTAGAGVALVLVVVVALVLARAAIHDVAEVPTGSGRAVLARGGLLAGTVAVLWFGSARFALEAREPFGPLADDEAVLVALATGTLLTVFAGLLPGRLVSPLERLVLLVAGAPAATSFGIVTLALAGPGPRWGLDRPEVIARPIVVIGLLAILAAVLVLMLLRRGTPEGPLRVTTAAGIDVLAPAALFLLLGTVARFLFTAESLHPAAPVAGTAALVAVATAGWSLWNRRGLPPGRARSALDTAAAPLTVVSLVTGALAGPGTFAVAALALGTVALLVATGGTGLFRSGSGRRHVAWLALPAWSLAWESLVDTWAVDVAAEVRGVPVGLLFLAAAVLIAVRGPHRPDDRPRWTPGVLSGLAVLFAFGHVIPSLIGADSPLRAVLWFVFALLVTITAGAFGVPALARTGRPGGHDPLDDGEDGYRGGAPHRGTDHGWASVLVGAALASVPVALVVAATRMPVSPGPDVPIVNAAVWFGTAVLGVVVATLLPSLPGRLPASSRLRIAMSVTLTVAGLVALVLAWTSHPRNDQYASSGILAVVVAILPAVWPRSRAVWPQLALLPVGALVAAGVNVAWHAGRGPLSPLLPAVAVAAPVLVALAAVALVVRPSAGVPRGARAIGLVTAPAALASAVAWVDRTDGLPLLADIGPAVIAVLAAVAAAAFAGRPFTARERLALDVSAAAVAAFGVLVRPGVPATWLGLALVAVVVAVDPPVRDQTRSRRRWLRWLGVAALAVLVPVVLLDEWPQLSVRASLLAAAAVLVAAGVLAARWRSSVGGPWSGEAFVMLASGGVAGLALTALGVDDDSTLWTVIALVVSSVVLLGASSKLFPVALRPYGDALALGAVVALVAGSATRAVVGGRALDAIAWVLPVLPVLTAAAWLVARRGGDLERRFARTLVFVTIGLATAVGVWICLRDPDGSAAGALVFVLTSLLAAAAVIAHLRPTPPFDTPTSWVAAAGALLVAVAGLFGGAGRPVELVTLPLAAATLTIGLVSMRRTPTLGSWRALTVGLALLLAPSLLAEFVSQPVWRLVGLGLVAVAMLVWGAVGRLRAPLVFGCAASLSHALMVFWPSEAGRSAVPWWAWLAVAGIMLVVLATTYEARDRDRGDGAASKRRLR
ncbi:hypothetical protein F8O01_09315 [Pseudoclavibacter chungangensis]|uniref:DUF2157 domain-containing protein n=1 Tax=Pseudoclavibacter chungangensis TaxID=587635 RepID=A0A7J5BRE3_9MICO|nr:hypothetical protein [Pseudoclavibacter chungangensis]KAB1656840.1 hypothetical protein F8O01_09315 [Pseudoclavibacter chungangensis]NYJ67300.1 hypothetical protein [Pseudoclavibacter chungangensis]